MSASRLIWRREFKFDLIERGNPDWLDLYDVLV